MKEPIDNIALVHKHCGINTPTRKQLDNLTTGQFIKLLDNEERFWAIIFSITEDMITAKVDTDLVKEHSFKCDDIITVNKKDIIGLLPASDSSRLMVMFDPRWYNKK
jgi:hypothetical protein